MKYALPPSRTADGLVACLATGAIQQHVDAARNRRTHLLNPVRGVIIEHLARAETPQILVVGGAGHAQGARAPWATAICTAALPTPPAAAVISTVSPACSRPRSTSAS